MPTEQNPLILAIETSGRNGSIGIARGGQLLSETGFSAPMRHSAEIFIAITSLLKPLELSAEQIEHVYISIGPGSFTGLRIAATLAKTMHLANDAKIVAVDTLDVIAANAADPALCEQQEPETVPERVATILDAKRSEFFVAVYERQVKDNTIWQKQLPDCLMRASQFVERFGNKDEPIWLLGEGLVYYKDKFKATNIRFMDECFWWPKARNVHLLGWAKALRDEFANPVTLEPKYLRLPDAVEKRKVIAKK
ncbi:tRNA (adenosine(37)-N6)-threonylcarbamoyltransferase complex dimerization subunit type 1 TsaB [Planctomycetota bacterium]